MFAFHKRDDNEREIVAALTAIGAIVCKIQGLSGDSGCPDLLVGYRGSTKLLEVKNPASAHQKTKKRAGGTEVPENAKGQLTPTQVEWWSKWIGGEAYVVETPEEAVRVVRGAELPSNIAVTAGPEDYRVPGSHRVVLSNSASPTHSWLTPDQADALAGALHEQAGVARALAAASAAERDKAG